MEVTVYKKIWYVVLLFLIANMQLYAFAGGSGSSADPWQISTPDHLDEVRNYLGTAHNDKHFVLINDIDMDVPPYNVGYGWLPFGTASNQFAGKVNGNGFSIENLFIARPTNWYIGLFGYIHAEAKISNLTLSNVNITGYSQVGGLAGFSRGTFTRCNVEGVISSDSRIGGLVGRNEGIIDQCSSMGSVTATTGNNAGGLVGRNYDGYIISSYSKCDIYGYGNNSYGGLIGWNEADVDNCFATGDVIGTLYCGGMVGRNYDGTISNCYATGNVTSSTNGIGGLVGNNGGLPSIHFPTIVQSFATGNVEGDGSVGGLAGINDYNITDCYATGTVYGTNSVYYQKGVGGLVGELCEDAVIQHSYSVGHVSGNQPLGGLVGYNDDGIVLCSYWDIMTSTQSLSAGGTGLTTEQMVQSNSFLNWDFSDVWQILEEITYPYLIENPQSPPPSPFLPAPTNLSVDLVTGLFTWNEPDYSGVVLLYYDVYLDEVFIDQTSNIYFQLEDMNNGQQYTAGVRAIYDSGESAIVFTQFIYQGVSEDGSIIIEPVFITNYPNPFKRGTTIHFALPLNSPCSFSIYDLKGKKIRTLEENRIIIQNQNISILWDGKDDDGKDVWAGVYLFKLNSEHDYIVHKILVIR